MKEIRIGNSRITVKSNLYYELQSNANRQGLTLPEYIAYLLYCNKCFTRGGHLYKKTYTGPGLKKRRYDG